MMLKLASSLAGLVGFFFFSSRRRHTRCSRDWSSDVCSSDLGGLALRVEAGRGLVEDQDARIGEDRPRNRDPLALAAGELHAPLTHDGVVTLLEATPELVAVGDPRRLFDVLAGRVRPGECDVL